MMYPVPLLADYDPMFNEGMTTIRTHTWRIPCVDAAGSIVGVEHSPRLGMRVDVWRAYRGLMAAVAAFGVEPC